MNFRRCRPLDGSLQCHRQCSPTGGARLTLQYQAMDMWSASPSCGVDSTMTSEIKLNREQHHHRWDQKLRCRWQHGIANRASAVSQSNQADIPTAAQLRYSSLRSMKSGHDRGCPSGSKPSRMCSTSSASVTLNASGCHLLSARAAASSHLYWQPSLASAR